MLYRQPRHLVIPAAFARIIGFFAQLGRTGADTAYLDSLNERGLRDIGVDRITTRDDHFYR